MAANLHPKTYLMYPAAVLAGLGTGPLWTSKCTYLTDSSGVYAKAKGVDKNVIVNRFFGIFFMFFQSAQIWGNLISYLILKPEEKTYVNGTIYNITKKYYKCGADFSEKEYQSAEVVNKIDRKTVNILCIIYVCVSDAVWQTQINALYGVLFSKHDEAAFSNYRFWESIGFAFFYIITPYIRIRIALIILIICLISGMIGYAITEIRWSKREKMIKKNQVVSS